LLKAKVSPNAITKNVMMLKAVCLVIREGFCLMAANEQVLLQVWNSLLVLPGTAAQ
jgi:hypothetical protein